MLLGTKRISLKMSIVIIDLLLQACFDAHAIILHTPTD